MSTNISLKHINKLAIPALISGVSEPILSLTDDREKNSWGFAHS